MKQRMILFELKSTFKDQMAGTPVEKFQAFCEQKGGYFGVGKERREASNRLSNRTT